MRHFREKPHTKLRILLDCYGVMGEDLAEWVGHSEKYISERMCAKKPWSIDDIYTIADNLNLIDAENPPLPYEAISDYFPPSGGATGRHKQLSRFARSAVDVEA